MKQLLQNSLMLSTSGCLRSMRDSIVEPQRLVPSTIVKDIYCLLSVAGFRSGPGNRQRMLRENQLADLVAALDDLHQLGVPVRARDKVTVLRARRSEYLNRRGGAPRGVAGA